MVGVNMNQTNLKNIFYRLQKQMIEKLSSSREIILHPGAKGDATEINWIEWLDTYLPKRYKVGKAFVIDSHDRISEEIDLVIYDQQYSPFVYREAGATYIPAESVYAIFEVKQDLSKFNLEYAGKKFKSVRSLHRTSAPIFHLGGVDRKVSHFNIVSGFVCLESSWKTPFGNSFDKAIRSLDELSRIDLGCVLQVGSFQIRYDGGISIGKSTAEESLIYFFFKVLMELQKLGTVPAMDIGEYAKALDSI